MERLYYMYIATSIFVYQHVTRFNWFKISSTKYKKFITIFLTNHRYVKDYVNDDVQ